MKIKYVDHRPITIPFLTYHRGGLSLPSGDNIIKVTDNEAKSLLKIRNGQINSFQEIKETKKSMKEDPKEEVTDDGSRQRNSVSGV